MKIVLLGPPGAGKGSLAVGLKEKYSLAHISTGDILPSAVATSYGGQAPTTEIFRHGLTRTDTVFHHEEKKKHEGFSHK